MLIKSRLPMKNQLSFSCQSHRCVKKLISHKKKNKNGNGIGNGVNV